MEGLELTLLVVFRLMIVVQDDKKRRSQVQFSFFSNSQSVMVRKGSPTHFSIG